MERSNSTFRQVLAQSVLTAGSRGVRTHWRQVSANMTSKIAHILLKIARIFLLASARRRTRVPTVCQQRRWQVLEHCANSRIRAGVGTKSVLTVHLSVLTLERRPCGLLSRLGSSLRARGAQVSRKKSRRGHDEPGAVDGKTQLRPKKF